MPVRGVVLDEETRKPVAGAIVGLAAETNCLAMDSGTRTLQIAVTEADSTGRFTVGGGIIVLPLLATLHLCSGWKSNIAAVAPGYYDAPTYYPSESGGLTPPWSLHRSAPVAAQLRRLRYLLPLAYGYRRRTYTESLPDHQVREDLETRLRSFRYRPLGPRGVFVSQPGTTFDRLAIDDWNPHGKPLVYAASSKTGAVYEWTDDGHPAAVKNGSLESMLLAADRKGRETALVRGWLEQSQWPLPAEKAAVEALLREESKVECIASAGPPSQLTFVIITRDTEGPAATVVSPFAQSRGRRVSRRRLEHPGGAAGAASTSGPPQRVTACTLGGGLGLYVAFAEGGIRRYFDDAGEGPFREDPFWAASRPVTLKAEGGPKTFTDIAVGRVMTDTRFSSQPAVYAVTGGPEIYRFGDEGEPDQRFEFD